MSMANTIFSVGNDGLPTYIKNMPTAVPGTDVEYQLYNPATQASDVTDNLASQLVRGTLTFSKERLKELDPSYTGFTQIFVLRMPEFMKAVADGYVLDGFASDQQSQIAKYHLNNLKSMLELASTSYQGTPELTLNTADINVGWSEKNYAAPTYSLYDSTNFSITMLETRREPLRRALEYYISGMADPNAKITHLHGAIDRATGNLMEPSLSNTTFAFMMVQTDNTLRNIQDISIWTNCIPTSVPRDQLNWTLGEIDVVQPQSISFRGIYLPHSQSSAIHKKARELMAIRTQYYKRIDELNEKDYGTESWDG